MNKKIIILLLVISLLFTPQTFAHSGRTDSSGGHKDNQNKSGLGYYHYHHGYGPHLHTNGVCFYSSNSKTTVVTAKPKISYSSEVKSYQYRLNKLNYNCGKDDGYFGEKTSSAVKAFQESENLPIDGKLNETTKQLIDSRFISLVKGSTSQQAILTSLTKNQLIQTKLFNLGYYTGEIDGSLGPQSVKAIKEFQKDRGLTVDGNVGPITSEHLELNL